MSYLYRPTPVFNPGPSRDVPLSRLPAGTMRGVPADRSGNGGRGYFDQARRAAAGKPWIVRSGTMGSFLGDDNFDTTGIELPLAPYDPFMPSLTAPQMPSSFFQIQAPTAPNVAQYDPNMAPPIISSGGSIFNPSSSPQAPGSSLANIFSSLSNVGVNIARAFTGQSPINPATPPAPPAGYVQPGSPAATSSIATLLSKPSSIFPSMSNGSLLLIGGGAFALLMAVGGSGYSMGRRR